MKMNWKKWIFGAFASLLLSAFVAGSSWVAGGGWQVFFVVFSAAAVTHYGAWMKTHPVDEISFGDDDNPTVRDNKVSSEQAGVKQTTPEIKK